MEPLLKKKVRKDMNETTICIRFTKYGNNHLYSNALWKGSPIQVTDLPEIDLLMVKSQYVKSDPAYGRSDGITGFHYFMVELRGEPVYLNVAVREIKNTNKREIFLFSVTRKLRETENG